MERLWSYFAPRKIDYVLHPYYLELLYAKDTFILNSQNANQSNASLKKAFHYAFHELDIYHQNFPRVLILGLGLGSIIELLQENSRIDRVIAYENNSTVLRWLDAYYQISEDQLKIKEATAMNSLEEEGFFDLILVDLFEDTDIPGFLGELEFWKSLISKLNPDGRIVWNTLSSGKGRMKDEIQQVFDRRMITMENVFYYYRRRGNQSEFRFH
jgi:spermidine synthase